MKPILFVYLSGALLVSAANAQFGNAQINPRFDSGPDDGGPDSGNSPPSIRTFTSPPLRSKPTLASNSSLPLQNVVLFSSGVGYFGRNGEVNGDATVDLLVRTPQISDILKSLVLFDPKGRIDPVTYSIEDYIGTRPTTTDLNIDPNSSPGAILRLLQGAQVRIERPSGAIEGRVVSVSTQSVKDGETLRSVEFATLLTASGLTTIRLDDVISFTPLDRGLADKFAATLEKKASNLTLSLDDGVRPITIHFRGKGKREVRAGYLLESPAWKTSYRLVIKPGAKPYLQGWAIVENPSDEDWNNVNMSLVSGRPSSFIQDLATPLYIVRPIIPPQIIGSPTPQTYGPGYGEQRGQSPTILNPNRANVGGAGSFGGGFGGGGFGGDNIGNRGGFRGGNADERGGLSRAPVAALPGAVPGLADAASVAALEAQNKVDAQATGAERGNLFVYTIDTKVTVPHGQAAMVPIISDDVEGEPLSIIQSQNVIGALNAQNGFRLRNRSDLNLQGGPITLYSDGVYGGDAIISNVSPGEARLIAYGVDLDLVSRLDTTSQDEEILAIRPTEGSLEVTKRETRTQKYSFRNKSSASKVVILQQPLETEWQLVDPKQLYEKTNDGLRFRAEVPAKKTLEYQIDWQKPKVEVIGVRDLGVDDIGFYARQTKIPPALKTQLLAIITLKRKANDLATLRVAQEKSLASIAENQSRIRANMNALSRESPLYKTYETKLAAQEDQVEKVMVEIDRLRAAEVVARQAIEDAITALGTK